MRYISEKLIWIAGCVTASLLLMSASLSALAQARTDSVRGGRVGGASPAAFRGKTYAMIVGISQYDFLPSLKFAHRDAQAFAEFLHSPYYSGGIVDDTLLLDANAKFVDIRLLLKDMYYRVAEGDRVILFFAGHGDREVETSSSYLLAHDTFHNNYAGTGISLDWLKRLIANFIKKKATVWLIADACRSGDFKMAGDHIKGRYRVWESWQPFGGEIDMLSCQPEELSYESQKWDEGHGVFSHYLMKGMKGAADSLGDKDFRVKAFELDAYLKLNVAFGALPAIQTPSINSADLQVVVSNIPITVTENINNALDQGRGTSFGKPIELIDKGLINPNQQPAKTRSIKTLAPVGQLKKQGYNRKRQPNNSLKKSAIKADSLVQNKVADETYYKVMKEVQPILLAYLAKGATAKPAEVYARASYLLLEAVQQMSPIDPDYASTRALHHFFGGLYQNTMMNWQLALAELSKALTLDSTKAFIFYERGRTYALLGVVNRADQDFSKAAVLSPTWSLPGADEKSLSKPDGAQLVSGRTPNRLGRRKALVIGNQNYIHFAALTTSTNNAIDMTYVLRNAGFSVSTHLNTDYRRTVTAINDFVNELSAKDTALFYYSGHSFSYLGDNYLLPVDAVDRRDSLAIYSFELEKLTRALKSKGVNTTILLLDASKTLPVRKEGEAISVIASFAQGLTEPDDLPRGSLVAFATWEGNSGPNNNQAGRNSLFTRELIKHLKQKNLSFREVINKTVQGTRAQINGSQSVANYDRLGNDFMFTNTARQEQTVIDDRPDAQLATASKSVNSPEETFPSKTRNSDASARSTTLKPIAVKEVKGINIKLIRMEGDAANRQVTISWLMTNTKRTEDVWLGQVDGTDADGNQYKGSYYAEHSHRIFFLIPTTTLYVDVPIICTGTLYKVPESVRSLARLRISFKTKEADAWTITIIEFDNLPPIDH